MIPKPNKPSHLPDLKELSVCYPFYSILYTLKKTVKIYANQFSKYKVDRQKLPEKHPYFDIFSPFSTKNKILKFPSKYMAYPLL